MNPINTALLSFGMSGEVFHGPLLNAHPGFTLSTVLQRTSSRAKELYPVVNIVRTLNDVLHDKSIELVVVNTPNDTHEPYATQALEAGKHVIVEKPFTFHHLGRSQPPHGPGHQNRQDLTVFQSRRAGRRLSNT